jgi:hypothetical protein
MRPPKTFQKSRVLDPSWTLKVGAFTTKSSTRNNLRNHSSFFKYCSPLANCQFLPANYPAIGGTHFASRISTASEVIVPEPNNNHLPSGERSKIKMRLLRKCEIGFGGPPTIG